MTTSVSPLLSSVSTTAEIIAAGVKADPATQTPSPLPIQVLTRSRADGFSQFFPFHDLATLNSGSQDLFSFKELIQKCAEGQDLLVLFTDGCDVGGQADCSRACSDNALLFSSVETFYNCIALSSIAYWTQETERYYITAEAERNASAVLGKTGSLATFDGREVLNSFAMCAQEACGSDGLQKPCEPSIKRLDNTSQATTVFQAMDDFCPDLQAEINPDIFGPGVLISYVLQVSFSGTLYLFLKAFTVWVRFSQKKKETQKKTQRMSPFGLTRQLTRIESMIWRDSSALSRTSIALATTLVEFQEAQCWFVFAIQIASILAIVVNSQEGTFWGEIVVNAAVAFHVSQNGILPMFLIQICLHHEGIRNWHTFLGFFVEYLLAIVATSQKVYFQDAFNLFKQENRIDACGGNPSPRSYCASTQGVEGLRLSFFPHPLLYKLVFLILDTIAIVILIFDQLSWTLRTHRLTKHMTIRGHKIGRVPNGRLKLRWLRLKRWAWRTLEVVYLVVNVLYLVSLIRLISADSFQANKWSYGQIIAMTVWGPVIVKLFDLAVSGPPKNGQRLNSGPPRLRIDNVINRRYGTSADDEIEAEEAEAYATSRQRQIPAPPELDLRQRSKGKRTEEDVEEGISDGISENTKKAAG